MTGVVVAFVSTVVRWFTREVDAGLFVALRTMDLLRLVAVPVFGWAAWRDVKTRRIANEVWRPLVVLGAFLFAVEAYSDLSTGGAVWAEFVMQASLAVGFVVPLAYLFWRFGGFGGADVKAVMVLAVLFPTYPTYVPADFLQNLGVPAALPVSRTPVGVFAFTILTNAVVAGAAYPLAVTARNAAAGRFSAVMFVGRPVSVDRIPRTYGRLLDRPDGTTRRGLDLDALRMYLRWRGISLSDLRADPDRYRDPASLPESPNDPTDGNVRTDGGAPDDRALVADGGSPGDEDARGRSGTDDAGEAGETPETDGASEAGDAEPGSGEADDGGRDADASDGGDDATGGDGSGDDAGSDESGDAGGDEDDDATGGDESEDDETPEYDDPWGAEAFLEDIEGTAYGTRPGQLRDGLEVLAVEDDVWVSPGLPFVVPLFLGLLAAVTYGDVFFGLLRALGVV